VWLAPEERSRGFAGCLRELLEDGTVERSARVFRLFVQRSCAAALALSLAACGSREEVGEFRTDWTGNEIEVEAVHDPDLPGVICHVTSFDRGLIDRVRRGNWFEDPSNTSIACQRIAALDLSQITRKKSGEEVFSQRQSLFFKNIAVRRILDIPNRSILYVSHSRQVADGSAKMSLSTVALTDEDLATLPTP
jgi:CreA protein